MNLKKSNIPDENEIEIEWDVEVPPLPNYQELEIFRANMSNIILEYLRDTNVDNEVIKNEKDT